MSNAALLCNRPCRHTMTIHHIAIQMAGAIWHHAIFTVEAEASDRIYIGM